MTEGITSKGVRVVVGRGYRWEGRAVRVTWLFATTEFVHPRHSGGSEQKERAWLEATVVERACAKGRGR